MAEAQEKRPSTLVRFTNVLGGHGTWFDAGIGKVTVDRIALDALLDKLDEAKHLHEVERDRANDLLSDRREAERERDEARAEMRGWSDSFTRERDLSLQIACERDEARAEVERLRGQMSRISTIPQVEVNRGIGDRSTPAAVEALARMFVEVGRERDDAQSSVELMRRSADRVCSRAEEAEDRVAELEAEVRRLRQAVNYFLGDIGMLQEADGVGREFLTDTEEVTARLTEVVRRWKHYEDMGGQALDRLAKLEEAIRREWANHREADPAERGDCMDRLLDLVEPDDGDPEESGDQPTTDIPTWIHDLDKRITADLNGLRDRLARLEARNG